MKSVLYILAASVSLILPWIDGFFMFAFISWIPLFYLWEKTEKLLRRALYTYIIFVLWNAGVTWWIWNASPGGAVMAILANALLMLITVTCYFVCKDYLDVKYHLPALIPFWLSFEYLHQYWDLSWTWLTLGNILSVFPSIIGWYSITGTSGGSLWILSSNVLAYYIFLKKERKWFPLFAGVFILPLALSMFMKNIRNNNGKSISYMIVQPNIDPYNEKFYFDFGTLYEKTKNLILRQNLNKRIDLLILPETFITFDLNEEGLNRNEVIEMFRKDFIASGLAKYILTGASTYKFYDHEKPSSTARMDKNSGKYYDMFNTAIWITSDTVDVYHKSILVPGVEKMPFPSVFKFLDKLAIDMGGTTGSLGMQEDRHVFSAKEGWKAAPIICYESVYGEYVGDYVRKGANVLCVITNDGWWGNTPGHRQHLKFGTLRCVEYGLPMLRSANTGISAVVDEHGKILKTLGYEQQGVLNGEISLYDSKSVYTSIKDIISRIMLVLSLVIFVFCLYKKINFQKLKS
ncbi:MAG: apolipoprotein N-acyltransferase [Bacteroidia bacterium]|nr:apolipoprotein N-acyltransferase [Bacteroidia bacterium]